MKSIGVVLLSLLAFAASAVWAGGSAQEEANKKLLTEFYERVLNQKDLDAIDKYVGPYKQHNPQAGDGPEGLKGYIGYLRKNSPKSHSEIKRVFADGDYVILHVHAVPEPGARGLAIMDIFRLDRGRIVEHWDVIQEVPEKAVNNNGMF